MSRLFSTGYRRAGWVCLKWLLGGIALLFVFWVALIFCSMFVEIPYNKEDQIRKSVIDPIPKDFIVEQYEHVPPTIPFRTGDGAFSLFLKFKCSSEEVSHIIKSHGLVEVNQWPDRWPFEMASVSVSDEFKKVKQADFKLYEKESVNSGQIYSVHSLFINQTNGDMYFIVQQYSVAGP